MNKGKALAMPEPGMTLDRPNTRFSGGLEVSAEVASDLAALEAQLTDPEKQKRFRILTPFEAATYLLRRLAKLSKI